MSEASLICEKIHLSGVKLLDLRSPQPQYPYSILLAQIMPEFAQVDPGFPLKQSNSDAYKQKIMKVLEYSIRHQVHFCILPEISLPRGMITQVRSFLEQEAVPGSIFCLPLEYVLCSDLPSVLDELGLREPPHREQYISEFGDGTSDKILNLCWIAAKGTIPGTLISNLQSKIFPSVGEEFPILRSHRFQGGKVLRVFCTDDTPESVSFSVLICFDFIAEIAKSPIPRDILLSIIRSRRCIRKRILNIDWLFVPQFNPKPIHPTFEFALDKFYHDHPTQPIPTTSVIFINAAGGFNHNFAKEGTFGNSALVGRFPLHDTEHFIMRQCPFFGGSLSKLTLRAESEIIFLYRDQLLSDKTRGPEAGRGFSQEFLEL